jgi:hypothetical protein
VSDRWVPVLAAVVGVLGGMGGAFVGGSVANQGQEQRFESEREAARQDVREDTYGAYLQAATGLLLKLQLKADGEPVEDEVLFDLLDTLVAAQAPVLLLADRELQDVSSEVISALAREDLETSVASLDMFIDLAQEDIAQTGE